MNDPMRNPFTITKASDFSDREILEFWVDFSKSRGLYHLAKPVSAMPMLILGGKGSGKTHLMRYFSYQLQRIRNKKSLVEGIKKEGYVGIYLRCEGLNANRFEGKNQSDQIWCTVFEYYMEIWLAQLLLSTVRELLDRDPAFAGKEPAICKAIGELFHTKKYRKLTGIDELLSFLTSIQRALDAAVNNCAITDKLNVNVLATRSRLIFGIPKILADQLNFFQNLQFQYLIDEIENLSSAQQKYINTLLRERSENCSFKLGAKLYGVKTYSTYSADEENKEGSEYEKLPLDETLRENPEYPRFAGKMIARRLREFGYLGDNSSETVSLEKLAKYFDVPSRSRLAETETAFVSVKYLGRERPYFQKLRKKLEAGLSGGTALGLRRRRDIEEIIAALNIPGFPLLEKVNIYLLYKEWSLGDDLKASAKKIEAEAKAYLENPLAAKRYSQILSHFKADLLAQLLRECGRKQMYLGIENFIIMSSGLPRNLLNILKHIFTWSVFNGERPFRDKISMDAQISGVMQAADWFFADANAKGADGPKVQDCISRLAELFREIRYSDKPAECSLSTFSVYLAPLSLEARHMIEVAEQYSLLIRVKRGARDRNTMRIDCKFQLNPMLAPRWDLPVARRGAIALSQIEAESIFNPSGGADFDVTKKTRVGRMTAPLFGKSRSVDKHVQGENLLFGMEE